MNFDFLHKAFPLADPLDYMSTNQGFGKNDVDFYKKLGMIGHNGIDYFSRIGTHTYATIDATVTYAGVDGSGGKSVRYVTEAIEHDGLLYRLEMIHYHLDDWIVIKNGRVNRGQVIGSTGNTGKYTTGPHLHFGVKVQWSSDKGLSWQKDYQNGFKGAVDPKPFLTYKLMKYKNPYSFFDGTLLQLTEGKGGFGLYSKGKLYVDDLDKIIASHITMNNGSIEGMSTGVTKEVWESYDHFDLKNNPL